MFKIYWIVFEIFAIFGSSTERITLYKPTASGDRIHKPSDRAVEYITLFRQPVRCNVKKYNWVKTEYLARVMATKNEHYMNLQGSRRA